MRRLFGLLICALLAFAALSSGRAANPATPSPMATPFDCPITRPSGKQPPEVANLGGMDGFGNDALWVSLVMWSEQPGIVEVPNDDHLLPDGTVQDLKWAWYRYALRQIDDRRPPPRRSGTSANRPGYPRVTA